MHNAIAFDTTPQLAGPHPCSRTGWAEDEVGRREELVRLGLWMFLATVTMLFAAFTSAYIVRRSGSDWRQLTLPPMLWLSTLVLGASSLALEAARWSGLRRRWIASSAAVGVAIAFGVVFLGSQILACRQLMAAGVYLPTNPHSSFFFMLTGAHAVHVVAALTVLVWGGVKTWSVGARDPRGWAAAMGICRTFWHYLGAVWIYLFLLVSLY